MIQTVVVVPSRYEPQRLWALVLPLLEEAEVIVLDNGHEPPLVSPDSRATVVDARGDGIYRMWNRGWWMALERHIGVVNVAVINDDIEIGPGTITLLAAALRADDKIGAVYPDASVRFGPLPKTIEYTTEWDPAGGRSLTGFCFMFKGELPIPPFDEGMEWWYGDSEFDESVKLAGYGVARIDRLPINHVSDTESNDWARRPELKEAAERDGLRWIQRHDRLVNGHWVPKGTPRAVLLVPRRADYGHRDRLWEYAKARWLTHFPDLQVVEGHHLDGPFNRSAAINRAAELAGDWDIAVVVDSDVMLSVSQVRAAIRKAKKTGHVTWGHRRWRGIREDATAKLVESLRDLGQELDRDELDLIVERTNPLSWSCCIVIPRQVWDDLGGFDERFSGWGFEDMAFQSVICGLYGWERIEGDVIHLWHPRSGERIVEGRSRETATPEYVTNNRLGRRYMVALRRDHQLHDRGDLPATEAERQRDIENLQRDDAKFARVAKVLGLPDWSGWWPTLKELRDGAKTYRDSLPGGDVTVIVRTGGAPETWPERSGYLKRSLASLAEHVSGQIVQRVLYSDWGPDHAEELRAIAAEHGFYVAGDGHHGYSGSVKRLWAYITKRAKGQLVFVAEDDFLYLKDVDLAPMSEALLRDPMLAQIALLRGPCYPREFEGGILGWPETSFAVKDQGNGHGRLEHRNFWTMNPSLFRRSLTLNAWPQTTSSERVFGDTLLRDPKMRVAFWGSGEPWIEHIGEVRATPAGAGY